MDLSTYERLCVAVDAMDGPGTIQQRLATAAHSLAPLKEDAVFAGHPELQARFDLVLAVLLGNGKEGGMKAATGTLSDEDAGKIAAEIFSLYCKAAELTGAHS